MANKYLLGISGVVSLVVGIVISVPSYFQEQYALAVIATLMVIGGLVLLAIAFGE